MSTRLNHNHSNSFINQAFVPNASLNNPLRVSTANKFDNLLNSDLGKKMFSRPQSKERTKKSSSNAQILKETLQKTPSFLKKMQNSGAKTGLKNSSSNPNLKDSRFEKAHEEITKINNDLIDTKKLCEDNLELLGGVISPQRRKFIFENLKQCQKRYKSLKESRLLIIKKQRIIKNEYPAGKEGLEVYNWQDIKRKEIMEIKTEEQKQARVRRLSTIHYVDPSLSMKAEPSAQKEIKRGLKRLNLTMPSHYTSSSIFTVEEACPNPSRHKRLNDFSHGHRNFNIITGACL